MPDEGWYVEEGWSAPSMAEHPPAEVRSVGIIGAVASGKSTLVARVEHDTPTVDRGPDAA